MRCAKCIHHNICFYEEEVIDPDKNNDCEDFEKVRPHGKWIDYSDTDGFIECPFCHKATNCEDNIDELHYCWNCGAEMKEGAE